MPPVPLGLGAHLFLIDIWCQLLGRVGMGEGVVAVPCASSIWHAVLGGGGLVQSPHVYVNFLCLSHVGSSVGTLEDMFGVFVCMTSSSGAC